MRGEAVCLRESKTGAKERVYRKQLEEKSKCEPHPRTVGAFLAFAELVLSCRAVHRDFPEPDLSVLPPSLVVTAENYGIEIWPRSHTCRGAKDETTVGGVSL